MEDPNIKIKTVYYKKKIVYYKMLPLYLANHAALLPTSV